jgi:hypothetical protein
LRCAFDIFGPCRLVPGIFPRISNDERLFESIFMRFQAPLPNTGLLL